MRNHLNSSKIQRNGTQEAFRNKSWKNICLADAFRILSGCFLGQLVDLGCHFSASQILEGVHKSSFFLNKTQFKRVLTECLNGRALCTAPIGSPRCVPPGSPVKIPQIESSPKKSQNCHISILNFLLKFDLKVPFKFRFKSVLSISIFEVIFKNRF